MEKLDDIKPDVDFIKSVLQDYRTSVILGENITVEESRAVRRLEFELTLLNIQTQEKLINTYEKSIVSQDGFSKNANFLAFSALILVAVEILITIFRK